MATPLTITHDGKTVDLSKLPTWFTLANPAETKRQIDAGLGSTDSNQKKLAIDLFNLAQAVITNHDVEAATKAVEASTKGGARKSRRRNRRKNGRSRRR